jgi:AraC-like DNA-binding protein
MTRLDRDLFRRLCRARELLREERAEPLSIARVADEVAISRFHFIRRFEQVFGLTPSQYRMRSRIERAKELLASGEHSVTECCMAVGFSSLGSFSALFHQRVGSSPSAYRRAMRVLVPVPGILPAAFAPSCFGLMAALPDRVFRNSREA